MKKVKQQEKLITSSSIPPKQTADLPLKSKPSAPAKDTNSVLKATILSSTSYHQQSHDSRVSQPVRTVIKFPSISRPQVVFPHIRNAAQYVGISQQKPVYNESLPLPTLTFKGTVKVDGANCAIVKTRRGPETAATEATYEQSYQSRQKILAPDDDFNGFAAHMVEHEEVTNRLFKEVAASIIELKGMNQDEVDSIKTIVIFGEWCGDTIQRKIAISQ